MRTGKVGRPWCTLPVRVLASLSQTAEMAEKISKLLWGPRARPVLDVIVGNCFELSLIEIARWLWESPGSYPARLLRTHRQDQLQVQCHLAHSDVYGLVISFTMKIYRTRQTSRGNLDKCKMQETKCGRWYDLVS